MSKKLWLLTLLVLSALIFAACSAPTQPQAPAAEAPAEQAAADEPEPTATPIVAEFGDGDTQLTYWHLMTGADGVTMQEMVESFVAENPDVAVRIESMPAGIYYDKLLTSMISGSPPDLFIVHEFATAGMARQNVFRDSSDLYASGGGYLPDEDFKPELLERLDYEGVRYGVPLDNLGWGTWINRDLFEAAGLDPDTPPANGEELIEMARQLTLDADGNHPGDDGFDPNNVAQWGIAINNPKNTFQSVLWQFGGEVFDAENSLLQSPEAQAALQYLYDLIAVEQVAPPPAGFDANQAFAAGQVAIMPQGTWMLNFMNGSDVNWDAWPMVQMGSQPGTRMSSHVLHMPQTLEGEKLAAATRLVNYLSDSGLDWAGSGQVPARFSVQESLDPEIHRAVIVFADSFNEQGRLEVPHPLKQEIAAAWEPEVGGAWDSVTSVEEALEVANERVQDVLDRYNR